MDGNEYVERKLKILESTIMEYFGMQNMLEAGIKPREIVEKPEAYKLYEQCKALGIPLVSGGVMDQPHIWLLEYGVIEKAINLNRAIKRSTTT